MKLIVTRPEPDASRTAHELEALGHTAVRAPLLDIQVLDRAGIADAPCQAILVTSANGIRALVRQSGHARMFDRPVYAVGQISADEAGAAGFTDVHAAAGDLTGLAAAVQTGLDPGGGALLYVTGDKIAGDLAGQLRACGYEVRREILYRAVGAILLPDDVSEAIAAGEIDGVVLMSPRSARIWIRLITVAGLQAELTKIAHFCLSPAVAGILREKQAVPDDRVFAAQTPNLSKLMTIIADYAAKR